MNWRSGIIQGAMLGALLGIIAGVVAVNISLILHPPPAKVDHGAIYVIANSSVWGLMGLCIGLPLGAIGGWLGGRK